VLLQNNAEAASEDEPEDLEDHKTEDDNGYDDEISFDESDDLFLARVCGV